MISELHRTKIGDIDISKSVDLESFLLSTKKEILDKYIINVDLLLKNIPSCQLLENDAKKIINGNKVKINKNASKIVKMYNNCNMFIGIGEINDNFELLPKKILL